MTIRNLHKRRRFGVKHLILFIVAFLCIYVFITFIVWIINRLHRYDTTGGYTLWASLTFSGTISVDNNFPNYTHSLVTSRGEKIGLKSSTINLNAYVNQPLELVGRLKKYFKITPILEVDTLKFASQSLLVNGHKYFFVKDLVYLDFSTQPQLSAIKSWNNIQVLFASSSVVSIERFSCSKIFAAHDCNALITSYVQSHKDTFESYWSYTFYKHGTGFWTAFDDLTYGFIFKDVSDDMVLDISNMFKIVNPKFVIDSKATAIRNACQHDFAQLEDITSVGTMTYHDPYTLVLGVDGLDNKNNPATCRITFDLRNEWKIVDVQFN